MWTVWPIFIFLYRIADSTDEILPCETDEDCSYTRICQNNVCKECIKCALLFRNGSDCKSDFNDCGPCLPGYKEISKTNLSDVVKPCRPDKLKSETCMYDEDCPVGTYCHEKFCAVCFDCSFLNKLPPNSGCAKDISDCGFCKNGYNELPVTINSNIKLCERKVPELTDLSKLMLSISNILPFCILLAFAAVGVKFIFRNHKENDNKVTRCEQPLSPSAPPLFMSDIPESILCGVKNEKCSVVSLATEFKQQANTARIFRHPHALYYFAEESAGDASDHSNDSNEEGSSPLQRSNEPEEVCSPSIFIHRYLEMRDHVSPSQDFNGNMRHDPQFNDSEDNVDSETPSENAGKTLPQGDDSSSSTS